MDANSDVIYELFGNISFTKLTTGLETEIDDLLWYLKQPLGDITYVSIRRESVPAQALARALHDRRHDKRLVEAFRQYVLTSDGLYHMLTLEARVDADRRKLAFQDTPPTEQWGRYPLGGEHVLASDSLYHKLTPKAPPYCGIYHIPLTTAASDVPPDAIWLPQVSLSSLTKLYDTASHTTLSQTFVNPPQASSLTSATYTFPLYESCAVVSFRCFVKDQLIEGVVKERGEAKAKYKEALGRGDTAGLLEQHTPDVFSASLGNIPAGESVRVEIEYIMELKHDAAVDGLRFTIPTSIAPRYGNPPNGLSSSPGVTLRDGINISIEVTMTGDIKSIRSPFHPISVHLGGHVKDEAFDSKRALAKLEQTSNELGKDFILLITCVDLSSPRALLETHPTISDSKALMVTFVPRFKIPESPRPEIVFIVDRSCSMHNRIQPLKSAMRVFLHSLPLGVKFNICSFGSNHSFLWTKSQYHSASSLAEALLHVESMSADLGGTEILHPIRSGISRRDKNLMLEIMVLTDGEVWNTEQLFEYVGQETINGDVRLFSLGIGLDVSHALIEGMARVGGGFAQTISDERERMEGKVVKMLRGALSPHINDYRLDFEGTPSVEAHKAPTQNFSLSGAAGEAKGIGLPDASPLPPKTINLFDTTADMESPILFPEAPDVLIPIILQAPHKLPSIFPSSRCTVYAILSGDVSLPPSIWLRGITPSGDNLELEIALESVPDKGQTIHQLAARKILQELEEGSGYIQHTQHRVNRDLEPHAFSEWAKRVGVQVALKYGLTSKWTSFLAVKKTNVDLTTPDEGEPAAPTTQPLLPLAEPKDAPRVAFGVPPGSVPGLQLMPSNPPTPAPTAVDEGDVFGDGTRLGMRSASGSAPPHLRSNVKLLSLAEYGGYESLSRPLAMASPEDERAQCTFQLMAPYDHSAAGEITAAISFRETAAERLLSHPHHSKPTNRIQTEGDGARVTSKSRGSEYGGIMREKAGRLSMWRSILGEHRKRRSQRGPPPPPQPQGLLPAQPAARYLQPLYGGTQSTAASERTMALIALRTFEGSFALEPPLAALFGTSITILETKLWDFVPSHPGLSQALKERVWATLLALLLFGSELVGEKDIWELVVEKARVWLSGLANVGGADIKVLEKMALEVFRDKQNV